MCFYSGVTNGLPAPIHKSYILFTI